jgi:bifunctional enzyme CysN/CysC
MSVHPVEAGQRYLIKHATRSVPAVVDEVAYCMDIHTMQPMPEISSLELNDIGRVRMRTTAPLAFDSYHANRGTGGFILIDEASNDTVAAGMIVDGSASA